MNTFMLVVLFIVNFAISWFNAWAVGKAWAESKLAGGWQRLCAWSGAIMSACGFTWCILLVLGVTAFYVCQATGHPMPDKYIKGFFALGYLTIVPPVIGTGFVLTVDSWAAAWRRRTFGSTGVAAWNTYAQISNMVDAVREMPQAFAFVTDMFSKDDDEDTSGYLWKLVVLLLFAVSVLGGILLTRTILINSARAHRSDLALNLGQHPTRFAH